MRLILFLILSCLYWDLYCQKESYDILVKCEDYYRSKSSGEIEVSSANKNFLKNDTNFYKQIFLYNTKNSKVGKLFYRDKTGFSIYKHSTTYYVYTYNDTYYVGENTSDRHLNFLPYWDPSSFFKKYFLAIKSGTVRVDYNLEEKYYKLSFSDKKNWQSSLYIKGDNFSLFRYNETYTDKKFGTQYKDYRMNEKDVIIDPEIILEELDKITNSFIRTTDENIKEALKEHEKIKNSLISSSINKQELLQALNISQYSNQYILLDYFYQTCLPCIKAIPELNALRSEFDTSLLVITGVDPIAKDAGHVDNFKLRYKVIYPLVDGERAIKIKKISLPGLAVRYPTLVLIRPDGIIEYIMEEYSKNHFKILRSYLRKINDDNN